MVAVPGKSFCMAKLLIYASGIVLIIQPAIRVNVHRLTEPVRLHTPRDINSGCCKYTTFNLLPCHILQPLNRYLL
jgi:hypothetical protein